MKPTLCLIGGCNGAGKTTLARELLPRMGIRRFLNADEIARGLSPLDPSLSAFRAGRLLISEAHGLLKSGSAFAIESTLSGVTHMALLRAARESGFRVVLHYILLDSADQAVARVALRTTHGGHAVPEADVRRRFTRSRQHFLEDYLPLADEWALWDNSNPPPVPVADHGNCTRQELAAMLESSKIQEPPTEEMPEIVRLGLEAGRAATAKMLDFYKRMGIRVTPQMTLAPEPKKRRTLNKKPASRGAEDRQ
ncbi:MAG TPA: AAA family ATPase [Verrucomicrobiales bacterium]|jgi:predicted ABC-type ATPase|nr:AAA family ATPase [Verrucomicrobiales bacterium]